MIRGRIKFVVRVLLNLRVRVRAGARVRATV